MLIMGYRITEKARKAARAAIYARRSSFNAGHIACDIKPLIRESKDAWPGMTVDHAAFGAAEALIWEEYRAGGVKPTGTWLRRQYWRVKDRKTKGGAR